MFRASEGYVNLGSLGGVAAAIGDATIAPDDGADRFVFDRVGDYLDIDLPGLSAPYTLGLWLRMNSNANAFYTAAHVGDSSDLNHVASHLQIASISKGRRIRSWSRVGGTDTLPTGGPALDPTQWHHAVVVVAGTNERRLYLDGTLVAQSTVDVPVARTDRIRFGGYMGTDDHAFGGFLDDMRLIDGALTAPQITDWHSGGRGYDATPIRTVDPTFDGATLTTGQWDSQSNGTVTVTYTVHRGADDSIAITGTESPGQAVTLSLAPDDYYAVVSAANDAGTDVSQTFTSAVVTVASPLPPLAPGRFRFTHSFTPILN